LLSPEIAGVAFRVVARADASSTSFCSHPDLAPRARARGIVRVEGEAEMPSFVIAVAAATIAASPTTLRANGVQVKIDLDGFEQSRGAGQLGPTYYRLGQFALDSRSGRSRIANGNPLVVSVLLDDVPPGAGMNELRTHVLGKESRAQRVTTTSVPPGFYYTYLQTISNDAGGAIGKMMAEAERAGYLAQWNLYFHTLHEGKWVELHFSSLQRTRNIDAGPLEAIALEVVRSLRVARKPGSGVPLRRDPGAFPSRPADAHPL
jgi:hypothetical protein